ncbi:MAG: prepilin peptidase [Bacilli bacterium]|nr:prepilin peptidase [Bacilli bacterium]
MQGFVYFFLFVFGTVFGSFFHVLNTRGPMNESIIKPGSYCSDCKHALKWYDLIPLLSYLFNGGKCHYCKKKISFEYFAVEFSTGMLFCLAYYLYGPSFSYELVVCITLFSLCINIYISDFKYYIILDSPLLVTSILVMVFKIFFFDFKTLIIAIVSGLMLFTFMLLIKKIGDFAFKRESLGGGDIKLSFVVGLILGLRLGLCALILSTFLAFPYAFLNLFLGQKKEVPFGPFIISACAIIYVFLPKFVNLLNYLFIYIM